MNAVTVSAVPPGASAALHSSIDRLDVTLCFCSLEYRYMTRCILDSL